MASKLDLRQSISRDTLTQITGAANSEADNIAAALDGEITPPLVMRATSPTPNRVVNIGAISLTNAETGRTRTITPINSTLPTFTSGTVTMDATGAGNAVPSSGSNLALGMTSSQFLKIGISLNSAGQLVLQKGTAGASAAAATLPSITQNTFTIGYVVVSTDGSNNVNNITSSMIFQYQGLPQASFDLLSPTTTKGDLIAYNGTVNVRVPVGTDGYALVADSGAAAGVSYANVVTNPMTTTGDIIYSSDNSGTTARLAIGASGTVLKGGTTPSYAQIVNADVSASAAIAGTKISPDFGSQNIITTGTGSSLSGLILTKSGASDQLQLTRTTSNTGTVYVGTSGGDLRIGSTGGGVDLLRVTTTTLQLGFAGSAGTPAYSWANDTDTGIYNNGDNTVRIATAGALAALFQDVSTSAAESLGIYKTPNDNTTANRFLRFYINAGGTNSGGIVANGANTAAFAVISDARTKENIIELGDELSKIRSLRPVEFDYIDGSGHQVGFIAQEMETVYPEYVAADENGFLNIAGWANKDAQMVKAMQQMADKIEELEEEFEAYKLSHP